ncbi:hypothetical protein [Flavobacterium sp.]|uniref:hypothetical protein n=1 Tax=Flavobacterium sp. TaxID=239 RepID=UPI00375189FE
MKNIVCVECWADRYFFGRLLNDFDLIRKEKNKNQVIKAFGNLKIKDKFLIGIVDEDKEDILINPNLKEFEILKTNINIKIYKHKINFHFIFALSPIAFESWLLEYINLQNQTLEDFDYSDFDSFLQETKNESIHKVDRFKNVINYVMQNYNMTDNHINYTKIHLDYLIEKKYQFNIDEFLEI